MTSLDAQTIRLAVMYVIRVATSARLWGRRMSWQHGTYTLGQRRKRWTNIESAQDERVVLTGMACDTVSDRNHCHCLDMAVYDVMLQSGVEDKI